MILVKSWLIFGSCEFSVEQNWYSWSSSWSLFLLSLWRMSCFTMETFYWDWISSLIFSFFILSFLKTILFSLLKIIWVFSSIIFSLKKRFLTESFWYSSYSLWRQISYFSMTFLSPLIFLMENSSNFLYPKSTLLNSKFSGSLYLTILIILMFFLILKFFYFSSCKNNLALLDSSKSC